MFGKAAAHAVAVLLAALSLAASGQETQLEAIVVTADKPDESAAGGSRLDGQLLPARRASTSDTARLLEDIPGAGTYGAGGISSLPVIRGLADDRLRTTVDGMDLMTACPNHMNPALSFIDPSKVESIEVFAGITPVSVGGDSIGSTIRVKSAPPKFAKTDEGWLASGELGVFERSNGHARGKNLGLMLAGEHLHLSYSESRSESGHYWAAGEFKKTGPWRSAFIAEREVGASAYGGSRNTELGLAFRFRRNHVFELKLGKQDLDFEGFPNQRMDMVWSVPTFIPSSFPFFKGEIVYTLDKDHPSNMNRSANLRYTGQYEWGGLEASLFRQRLRHHMDMLQDSRLFGLFMPMDAESTTVGGLLKASFDLSESDILRVGYDFQRYRYDDWWPPLGIVPNPPFPEVGMCCGTFWNIHDGRRDRAYLFAEWESRWNPFWLTQLGIRSGTVESDAGPVRGYNSGMYGAEAAAFNARDRHRKDRHLDWTVLARYTPDATQTYEAGLARKTRSPNLLERYPWTYESMAMSMNNFVGDGNAYVGNMDLKPEVAHTLSAGADWHDANREKWSLKLTGHLSHVRDFIDAERCTPGMSTRCTAANVTATDQYVKLRYANQAARLYGYDLSGQAVLGRIEDVGRFEANGMLSYLRGENRTSGGNLYHILPRNLKVALVHRLGRWTSAVEIHKVGAKTRVSQVRNETPTPGYTLLNLRTALEWQHARLDIALENALNRFYLLPLGGAYLGEGNSMALNAIPHGMVLPGKGRSLNVAMNVKF